MQRSPTRSSAPKLSEFARHVVAPAGIVSTGWPAVSAKCADLGVRFRPWQVPVGKLILAKRADGKYAATVGGTGLSIPRQVGKTFLVGAIIFALCLLRPNLTVIWTAHRLRTAEETFKKMRGFARRKKIAPHILRTVLGSGEGAIEFRNGSRILFGARERGFGRGFDEVDVLIFDEAQILTDNALDDMVPATNQSRQDTGALQLYMGTPPKPENPSEVFTRMRSEALSGEDDDTAWVEMGADPGYTPTPAPRPLSDEDLRQIAKANPSFPDDTPLEAIMRMRKKLGPESFVREGMGVWDEEDSDRVLPNWGSLKVSRTSQIVGAVAIGVDVSPDRRFASVAVAGVTDVGRMQVEVVASGAGLGWVPSVLTELVLANDPVALVIDRASAAAAFQTTLEAEGIEPTMTTTAELGQACGGFYDDAEAGLLAHLDDPALNAAVAAADTRKLGDAWAWNRRGKAQITPLVAATLARYGYVKCYRPPRKVVTPQREASATSTAVRADDLATAGF